MDDLIPEFLAETNESLNELDVALVQLEQNPNDKELLSEIFRVMHTIKGTSGFLGLPRLGSVAHKAEDLLGLFRDEKLQPNSDYVSLILEAIDTIKVIIEILEQTGKEPEGDDSDLIGRLAAACSGDGATPAVQEEAAEEHELTDFAETEEAPAIIEEPVPTQEDASVGPSETKPAISNDSVKATPGEPAPVNQTLRVSVDVLEDLMTLVGELVLTRNQILQVARTQKEHDEMSGPVQRLNHIVSDLQEGVMKTRMQPVGNAWSKLPRIVRDIANDLGKKIELEMLGQETELDRQVLEMIKDPLTHMVRNSADHGIEKPADRTAAGKSETGHIVLNSYHEGGYILIEISDDGRGLSLSKIKQKIINNNLASEAEVAAMTEQQIQQFIFHAGFSTAETVTSVSGRGVGMDVVRTNIEKIGGSIEMDSIEGKGTTFTIKIPLTLAIISSLIVGIAGERFAIPQLDVTELLMITGNGANQIEMVNDTPVFRLRERILPLICLKTLLGFETENDLSKLRYIAVVKVGSDSFGLIVDQVFDTEEIVVKPVNSLLNDQTYFSGNTIMGDGQVIMILDSAVILKSFSGSGKGTMTQDREKEEEHEGMAADETSMLLFTAGNDSLKAVPLEHVARLEEVDLANVEYAGGKRVVQYVDTLMPLHLCDPQMRLPANGRKPVIVFKTGQGMMGLVVDEILDITTHKGDYQIKSDGALEGSAIIQNKTTDIINLSFDRSSIAGHDVSLSGEAA